MELLNTPAVAALALTLLHSCWLFVLIIGAAHLLAGRFSRAARRHDVYLAALLCLPLASLLTYAYVLTQGAAAGAGLMGKGAELWQLIPNATDQPGSTTGTWTDVWPSGLVGIYTLGLLYHLVQGARQYASTRNVRHGGLLPPPALRELFAGLRAELGIPPRVRWRITDRVQDVLTVGILCPVILFPVGLVTHLSTDEVAALLRHEFAHVRRYDPFWNAVQELTRRVFFYHPLVHWLTRQIDLEREYACDDAVAPHTGRAVYARALIQAAKYSLNPKSPFTMAATDQATFTQRVQRLFVPAAPTPRLATSRRSLLLALFAVFPLCLTLVYGAGNHSPLLDPPTEEISTRTTADRVVTGHVMDINTRKPLIGVTVVLEGTEKGTITDLDGNYEIALPDTESRLVFGYVGYLTNVITVPTGTKQAIVGMAPEAGDVQIRVSDNRDGTKGGTFSKERILYIVDGKPLPNGNDMNDLNADDIASINVIKDKEKLAALGHGTDFDGAVLITLKK